MSNKKYKLLRDLPNIKSGTIMSQDEHGALYVFIKHHDNYFEERNYTPFTVENNPDWFQEIKESNGYTKE